MTLTSTLAPLRCNPVLVASCARTYRRGLRAEEQAPTLTLAWRAAAASQKALKDLRAAEQGQPLPSVMTRLARAAKRAAKTAMASLASVGRTIAMAMKRAAAKARSSVAAGLAAMVFAPITMPVGSMLIEHRGSERRARVLIEGASHFSTAWYLTEDDAIRAARISATARQIRIA